MAYFRVRPWYAQNSIEVKPWATATDQEIVDTLTAYYAGQLSLANIQAVWSVGDKRSIPISAMSATGVSESHHADNYDYTIIDFDHDLLVNPINGKTKALITVQQDRIFYKNTTDMTYSSSYPSAADEGGYINRDSVNNTGWNTCARRTWCNSVYKAALPQYIQDNLKQVYKSTANKGNTSSPTWVANTDYCFLLSEWEILGFASSSAETGNNATHYINSTSGTSITMPAGGTKYSYFATTADRYKMPTYTANYVSSFWWERSPSWKWSDSFCHISSNGDYKNDYASKTYGLAPAWAL